MSWLYYNADLYGINGSDEDNYYLFKHNRKLIKKHYTPIYDKPETDEDSYMFLQFDFNWNFDNTKIFNKSQEDYIIFKNIELHKNEMLIITYTNKILSYKIIYAEVIDNHIYYYKLKHIIDNLKALKARQEQQRVAGDYNEEASTMFENIKLINIRELIDTVEKNWKR